ncbi:MAG: hypothetical protein H7222_02480 [Methylotenera sp.]|nr:hypothetical protein [Oligoflexia bacterium]
MNHSGNQSTTGKRIGVLTFPAAGHLQSIVALAQALEAQGHEVVYFSIADGKALLQARGIEPVLYGEPRLPLGSLKRLAGKTVKTSSYASIVHGLKFHQLLLMGTVQDLLPQLKTLKLSVLLGDELILSGKTLGECLKIPFIGISQTLSIYPGTQGSDLPPFVDPAHSSWLKSQLARMFADLYLFLLLLPLQGFRQKNGLRTERHLRDFFSSQAHLLPYARSFSPASQVPGHFHFTGPLISLVRSPTPQMRSGIYASLGTLVDLPRKERIFSDLLQCEIDRSLLISLGSASGEVSETLSQLANHVPAGARVESYVRQLEVLPRSEVMVTHGGLNSVQECILTRTPMLVLPIKHDQLGVAARVRELGLGEVCTSAEMASGNLSEVLKTRLTRMLEPSRQAFHLANLEAQALEIESSGRLQKAVAVVEEQLSKTKPAEEAHRGEK